MYNYKLVDPKDYLPPHIELITNFKNTIQLLAEYTDEIMGIKDINSTHIMATSAYAKIIGLNHGFEVAGLTDFEMPCSGTVEYAAQYVKEDKKLMASQRIDASATILKVHYYSDGLKARVFKKRLLHHAPTQSILGIIYTGYDVEMEWFLNIIPNYIIQFGSTGNFEVINNNSKRSILPLTDYEQEICFLLLLNWDYKQIAEFMNVYRAEKAPRTADTIIKKKNYICNKLNLEFASASNLCNYLVNLGFHNKLPTSFYSRIIGSHPLKTYHLKCFVP